MARKSSTLTQIQTDVETQPKRTGWLTKRIDRLRERSADITDTELIRYVLFFLGGGLFISVAAAVWSSRASQPIFEDTLTWLDGFGQNFSTEMLGVVITFILLEVLLAGRREQEAEQREQARLILQLGSPANQFAIEAARQLAARGWLGDGSLQKAVLLDANLSGAVLLGANLSEAHLQEADLSEALLEGANLSEAVLGGADLSRAMLDEANLSWANLDKADLSEASLQDANLSGARLYKANLSGARLDEASLNKVDLHEANLSGARLDKTNLSEANLRRANLSEVSLFRANLSGADLRHATLSKARLQETNLSRANLRHATLSEVSLSKANLSGANLDKADLSGANLWEADLSGADLKGAERLTVGQLRTVFEGSTKGSLEGATLPDGTKLPAREKRAFAPEPDWRAAFEAWAGTVELDQYGFIIPTDSQ